MNTSFYNGVSGIKSQQFGIDVWAGNIANINKPGYKFVNPEFSTVFDTQLANSLFDPLTSDIGVGSRVASTTTNFQQGGFITTESKYDMAIEGEGWFGVLDHKGEKYYTRAGAFNRDAEGYLVDPDGNYVTGTLANNIQNGSIIQNPKMEISLTTPDAQTKINLPEELTIPPEATTYVNFKGSLDPKPIYEFDPDLGRKVEVPNIEVFRTILFDSQGNANTLEVTFKKQVPQPPTHTIWDAEAKLFDPDKNLLTTQNGQIGFNERGAIVSNTLTSIDNNGTAVRLGFGNFYDPNTPNSGYDGLVSLADLDSTRAIEKDGHGTGHLQDYGIDGYGNIIAQFDNGSSIPIAKVAIYHFQNDAGLERETPVYFHQTSNSGKPIFYKDTEGNIIESSRLQNQKLEMSNLDLGNALTELLVIQKAFDASAKSITTSDQLIQNAINMKR